MIRRPRVLSSCPRCASTTHELHKTQAILAAIVVHVGGNIELNVEKVRALAGTEMVIESHAGVWTVTAQQPAQAKGG